MYICVVVFNKTYLMEASNMAKNTLGELENAPGAARREMAHMKREAMKSSFTAAAANIKAADILNRNARVADNWADLAWETGGQMKKEGWEYRRDSREDFKKASDLHKEATELQKQARDYKWSARKDSVVAFCQTWGARLHLTH